MIMESIVRPFIAPDAFTARKNVPAQKDSDAPEESKLEWKGGQSSTYSEAPAPYVQGYTVEWEEDKSQRVTEKVRVENPDDSSQYVELERIKKTVFRHNLTGEEMPLSMDWS